jgi:Tol biopolymer transport system component
LLATVFLIVAFVSSSGGVVPAVASTTAPGTAQVFVVGADGHGLRKLTSGFVAHAVLGWLPGGSALADVASSDRGRARVQSQRLNGPGHQDLSTVVSTGLNPPLVFSAARRLTAVVVCCHDGNALEILGAPGSRPRRLDSWLDGVDPGSRTAGWSPTGALIAYARVSGTQSINGIRTAEWEIAVIAPNGKRRRILTSDIASPYVAPVFSPDGRSIVFCANGAQPGLYTVPATGGPVDQLTEGDCDGYVFDWSPDGREIAYIDSARGTVSGSLLVMDVLTKRVTRLAGPVQDWDALGAPIYRWPASGELAWSPDSRKIAFAGSAAVETINVNGTHIRELVHMPQSETYSLAWSPKDKQIAFTVQHIYKPCHFCY